MIDLAPYAAPAVALALGVVGGCLLNYANRKPHEPEARPSDYTFDWTPPKGGISATISDVDPENPEWTADDFARAKRFDRPRRLGDMTPEDFAKPDPATEASELFAKADADAFYDKAVGRARANHEATVRPRYIVPRAPRAGYWFVSERYQDTELFTPLQFAYARRSSALRAARRLNAKEAAK